MSGTERLAPNPKYEQLRQLLSQLQADADRLRTPYRDTLKRMSDKIWIGPAARKWTTEVEYNNAQMRSLISRAIQDVEQALRSTPKELDPKSPQMNRQP